MDYHQILKRILEGVSAHELVAVVAIIYLWRRLSELEDSYRAKLEQIIAVFEREVRR